MALHFGFVPTVCALLCALSISSAAVLRGSDGQEPCCKTCPDGKLKYFSIPTAQGEECGECCLKPANVFFWKLFEPKLQLGNCAAEGYTVYESTETDGVGPLSVTNDRYVKPQLLSPIHDSTTKKLIETFSSGAWESGGNQATAVPGAKTLQEGAVTTDGSFLAALRSCTKESCDVFFNFHTNFSFHYNDGAFGLARGRLELDEECGNPFVRCYRFSASSDNTNRVTNIPRQLPAGAGRAFGSINHRFPFGVQDLELVMELSYDQTIVGNSEIIGAHLHTGADTVNGPVNIVFCGSTPLPAPLVLNGPCSLV